MKYLYLLGTALAVSTPALVSPALADEADVAPFVPLGDAITVIATGSALRVDQAGQPVSVVGSEEIDSIQGPDVARVLERLPGVTFSRNGSIGGTTSLFVRGANSQQLLVLVDGLRVADIAAPSGGFDFGNLMTGPVGRVELLRGSNSVVWGSEAIGGVLAITSRDVNGVEGSAEYGARDSFDGQVSAGLSGETYGVNLNGGYMRTDGISQAASGTEADGFRQWRAGGRAHVDLVPGLTASVVGRFTDGTLDLDGYPAPDYTFADTPEYQKTRELGGRAGLTWTGDALTLDAGYQVSDTRRRYYDPTISDQFNSETQGRSERAELSGSYDATDAVRLDFGGAHEWSHIKSDDFLYGSRIRADAELTSVHGLLGYYGNLFSLAAGVRYDDHSNFGDKWTFGANGSVTVAAGWRIRASYGEGFKVPTLYQLFSEYGNPELMPERSRSYDAGIEYGDRNGPLHFAVTGFRRDSRNLIDYVSCFGSSDALCGDGRYGFYANVGKARATGAEIELGARVSERLRASAVYTYVKSVNRTAGDLNRGNDLARRPRNALTVSADWDAPLEGLTLGGDIRMVSDSYNDNYNLTPLDGYVTATLRASYTIAQRYEVFARIENLTDADYTTVSGYGTPGRSAYAGVRVKM
ncbi:TonB-dependent siderophore receptor [Novosphingobium sp. PP1Y]|uniref:TonB-dependent receptor plug domain-containing protein n=1 Tax=Novosphingobium sp. PP1Y TaxID=702113 RepID=UPI00020EECAF|nr:TonB-dependent receptor [Novosphingobium sp. PP1Y]CCA92616.1 TonB-dependent receptor [Novosphingobium sp. PP1Y]